LKLNFVGKTLDRGKNGGLGISKKGRGIICLGYRKQNRAEWQRSIRENTLRNWKTD